MKQILRNLPTVFVMAFFKHSRKQLQCYLDAVGRHGLVRLLELAIHRVRVVLELTVDLPEMSWLP